MSLDRNRLNSHVTLFLYNSEDYEQQEKSGDHRPQIVELCSYLVTTTFPNMVGCNWQKYENAPVVTNV
jgi:hypothetical protein